MNVSTGPMVDPAEGYAIESACLEYDRPDVPPLTAGEYAAGVAVPWAGHRSEFHLGRVDGVPVGLLTMAFPQKDNLDNANIEIAVLPGHRRRGVGRALFDLAVARLRADGRKRMIGEASRAHPDGPAFAEAMGATVGLEDTRSVLHLAEADDARLGALLSDAWTHAEGYRLILWTGMPPEEIIDDVAHLDSTFVDEAPIGDLVYEAEVVDAERIREGERARVSRGRVSYSAGALHGDRLVAWTQLSGSLTRPAHAWQSITLVDRGHRGHRLGLLIKLANLAQLRELHPGVERISTFNATSNAHMRAINELIGFRPVEVQVEYQWAA
jgi:GNAT superfamily N-acetyltransferase/RimJ/RimL family protein N-acetyltransferase